VDYLFELTGIGDKALENAVIEDVKKAGYSKKEMSDTRIPAGYSMFDYMPDAKGMINRAAEWNNMVLYKPDDALTADGGIRAAIKKIIVRIFRWYVVPIAITQEHFNQNTKILISELITLVSVQNRKIENLQSEISELRNKDV